MSAGGSAVVLAGRQREVEVVVKATGYCQLQAHGPAGSGRLQVGRNTLPEHPVHNTPGGEAPASETPNAR